VPEIPNYIKGVWTLIDKRCSPNCYSKDIISICKYPIKRSLMTINTANGKIREVANFNSFILYPPENLNKMYLFSLNEYDEFGNSFGGYFNLWYDPKKQILFQAELGGIKDSELINRIDLTKEKCHKEEKKVINTTSQK
jgi:hypothetical protein